MKTETLLVSSAMALFAIIFAVLVANAMAPPEKTAGATRRQAAAPPAPPPPAQSALAARPEHQAGAAEPQDQSCDQS